MDHARIRARRGGGRASSGPDQANRRDGALARETKTARRFAALRLVDGCERKRRGRARAFPSSALRRCPGRGIRRPCWRKSPGAVWHLLQRSIIAEAESNSPAARLVFAAIDGGVVTHHKITPN